MAVVKAVKPGSPAGRVNGLTPGLVLGWVNDEWCKGGDYFELINTVREERPLKLNFGDNEVMSRAEKQEFVNAYDAAGVRLPWSKGDVAVACNIRTAHGRPAIHLDDGDVRQLGVVLGPVMRKKGVYAERRPRT